MLSTFSTANGRDLGGGRDTRGQPRGCVVLVPRTAGGRRGQLSPAPRDPTESELPQLVAVLASKEGFLGEGAHYGGSWPWEADGPETDPRLRLPFSWSHLQQLSTCCWWAHFRDGKTKGAVPVRSPRKATQL